MFGMGMKQYTVNNEVTTSELIAVARNRVIEDRNIFFPIELLRRGYIVTFTWDTFFDDMIEVSKSLESPITVTVRGNGKVKNFRFDNGDMECVESTLKPF